MVRIAMKNLQEWQEKGIYIAGKHSAPFFKCNCGWLGGVKVDESWQQLVQAPQMSWIGFLLQMFGFPKSTQHRWSVWHCLALCALKDHSEIAICKQKKHKALALAVIHVILSSICATPVWNNNHFCSINSSIGIFDADVQLKTITPKGTCFDLLLFARNVQDNPPSQKHSWRVFFGRPKFGHQRQWPKAMTTL